MRAIRKGAADPRGPLLRGTLAAALAAVLLACNTGSETGNPSKVSGLIRTPDGIPSAGSRVILVPEGFVPASAAEVNALPQALTDSDGRYRFSVEPGTYSLEALNPADGTRCRAAGLRFDAGRSEIPAQTLAAPGSIAASLAGAADTVTGFIYIPGSTYRAAVRAATASVRLDSVPPGLVDSLSYCDARQGRRRAFAWGIRVEPEASAAAAGPYLAWRKSALLRIDGARAGAAVAGLPLRVPLPDSVAEGGGPGGSALRAANGRGEPLPCEFAPAGPDGGAALWVRMDTVAAGKDTPLRIHWDYGGEGTAPSPWAPGAVFSAADGFIGAWHLDESPSSGRLADATGQGNDGAANGYAASAAAQPGPAGGALSFDGKSQFVVSRRAFDDPEVFTALVWFRAGPSAGGRLFEFADKDSARATYWDRLLQIYADGTVHFGVYPPDTAGRPMPTPSSYRILGSAAAYDDDAWHQAAVRLSREGQVLFVDGARVAADTATRAAQNIKGYWRMGYGQLTKWGPAGTGEWFQGALDEFWVAHAALPDAYVGLSYENLKPGSRLVLWP